jgi:hypothetical protein
MLWYVDRAVVWESVTVFRPESICRYVKLFIIVIMIEGRGG